MSAPKNLTIPKAFPAATPAGLGVARNGKYVYPFKFTPGRWAPEGYNNYGQPLPQPGDYCAVCIPSGVLSAGTVGKVIGRSPSPDSIGGSMTVQFMDGTTREEWAYAAAVLTAAQAREVRDYYVLRERRPERVRADWFANAAAEPSSPSPKQALNKKAARKEKAPRALFPSGLPVAGNGKYLYPHNVRPGGYEPMKNDYGQNFVQPGEYCAVAPSGQLTAGTVGKVLKLLPPDEEFEKNYGPGFGHACLIQFMDGATREEWCRGAGVLTAAQARAVRDYYVETEKRPGRVKVDWFGDATPAKKRAPRHSP